MAFMKLEVQHLVKRFRGGVRALDDVSLTIEPGQIAALLGPNGAGKTTLLRALAGIVAPDDGKILYDGEVFVRQRLDLKKRFLFLPDFPAIFDDWTALQHLGMVLRLFDKAEQAGVEDQVVDLLLLFDLLTVAKAPLGTLSRGQRYKVALAALLAVDPDIWMLDEPFASGMDPLGISTFKQRARDAAARGRTVIYSTQILDAAERFSDRVCVIHRGKVRAFEATSEIRKSEGDTTGLDELFQQLREEELS
jgi:ABC-type multidrug transport system ATPase subunit